MTAFEHCHSCKPPVRHPGSHSECPHYQVDIAKDRAKNRAKTFPGIAKAMAEQWGGDIRECEGHHGRV